MAKVEKVQINSEEMQEKMLRNGCTAQSMGPLLGCTGACIRQWMRRGIMPKDLYEKIMRVLNKEIPDPTDLGCNLEGDLFMYHGKPVWINLRDYYERGWHDCGEAMQDLMDKYIFQED